MKTFWYRKYFIIIFRGISPSSRGDSRPKSNKDKSRPSKKRKMYRVFHKKWDSISKKKGIYITKTLILIFKIKIMNIKIIIEN